MLSKIGYYLLKGISRMPFWFIYALSDVASWVLCYVVRYRRKTVLDNLRLCFPEQSPAWRRRVARRVYRYDARSLEDVYAFSPEGQGTSAV